MTSKNMSNALNITIHNILDMRTNQKPVSSMTSLFNAYHTKMVKSTISIRAYLNFIKLLKSFLRTFVKKNRLEESDTGLAGGRW